MIFFLIFSSFEFDLIRYTLSNIYIPEDLGYSIVLLPRAASALLYHRSILEKTRASVSTNFIHHPTNCLDFLLGKSWPAPEAKFCESVFWFLLETPPLTNFQNHKNQLWSEICFLFFDDPKNIKNKNIKKYKHAHSLRFERGVSQFILLVTLYKKN